MIPRKTVFEHEVRVLIVEDSPADADLMLRTLKAAGLRAVYRVVQEEEPFRAGLDGFQPDIVLTDNSLPRFSARRALRIARRHDPLLPVVLVTGTLREDRAVRLLFLGLADYVLKDRMLRIGPAVAKALERAETGRQLLRDRAALEARERRFRAVAEASGDGLVIVDDEARIVFWNAAAMAMFGYGADQVLGERVTRLVPEAARARHRSGWERSLAETSLPAPFTAEVTGLRADGAEFPVELTVSAWEEDGRRFFSGQLRDLTRWKEEARTRLILSEAVRQTTTSVVITHVDGAIEYVNPAFESMTGYAAEEVVGRTPRVLKSGRQGPEFYERLWRVIAAGRVFTAEVANRRKDGSEFVQNLTIYPIVGEAGEVERFVGLGYDVTEQRRLEAQLRQSQKMEAVGQLASGIAHDFNNILTGVLTNAQLLDMSMGPLPAENAEYLDDIVGAARRGAQLVRRLMGLVRSDSGCPARVDVRTTIEEAVRTVRRMLPESIEISLEQPVRPLPCVVDESEFQQALFNLCNNARDAMPGGGRLDIRTLRVGDAALLEVRDNGAGMEPHVLDRIFEPFFTTKEVGKGTGLGLPMVYGFARRSGGEVCAESRPGVGSTFRVTVPLAPEEAEGPAAAWEAPADRAADAAGGTVLVAEDQDDIRRVARKLLEELGYRVLTASDGVEALATLGRERGRIDLVLSDLVMPRGGGGMLYRATLDWPDQPRFLFMTGYGRSELNGDEALLESVPVLPKPWTLQDLEAAVARAMAGEHA